jgi:hypothetical protein
VNTPAQPWESSMSRQKGLGIRARVAHPSRHPCGLRGDLTFFAQSRHSFTPCWPASGDFHFKTKRLRAGISVHIRDTLCLRRMFGG